MIDLSGWLSITGQARQAQVALQALADALSGPIWSAEQRNNAEVANVHDTLWPDERTAVFRRLL